MKFRPNIFEIFPIAAERCHGLENEVYIVFRASRGSQNDTPYNSPLRAIQCQWNLQNWASRIRIYRRSFARCKKVRQVLKGMATT